MDENSNNFIIYTKSYMKIIVSIMLASILSTYSIVAFDFFEILNSTYCFINIPQNVIARIPEVENISAVR